MNIQSLLDKIDLFNELIIESGFKRDLEAYQVALQNAETQTNLISLKEIAQNLIQKLNDLSLSGLPEELDLLFPKRKVFTNYEDLIDLETIIDDPEIDTSSFNTKLNEIVTALLQHITSDETEIKSLRKVFLPYAKDGAETDDVRATLSIIFRDEDSIHGLKSFSQALARWNRTLLIYHQLVTSESPEDVSLVTIQEGSLDVIFNIDVKVAIDLSEVIKIGLLAYGAYLGYKGKVADIVAAYFGNQKLLKQEQERDDLLLANIKEAVKGKLQEQHRERRKTDKNIENTSLTTKYEQVAAHITEQIIKGNEIRLLSAPQESEASTEDGADAPDIARELREKNREVRLLADELSEDDRKLLTTRYEVKDVEN